jgi:phosphoribosylformylglycinamidine synthase
VSGKDSLNNCYVGADGRRHGVPPTLVITAVAGVPAPDLCPTTDLATAGDVLMLLGATGPELGGSHLAQVLGLVEAGPVPPPDPAALERYRRLHAAIRRGLIRTAHDVSEGGVAVTLAEMAIGGGLGLSADLAGTDAAAALFGESPGRVVVAVAPDHLHDAVAAFGDDAEVIGAATSEPTVTITAAGVTIMAAVADLAAAWRGGPHGPVEVRS